MDNNHLDDPHTKANLLFQVISIHIPQTVKDEKTNIPDLMSSWLNNKVYDSERSL